MHHGTKRAAFSSLLAVGLLACAAQPGTSKGPRVELGRRAMVRYVQVASGQAFSLRNTSSGSKAEVYGDPQRDRLTKVIGDATLQALIDVLGEQGMFLHSQPVASNDAKECLVVELPERKWVWTKTRGSSAEPAFVAARGYFLTMYNQTTAYHGSSGEAPPNLAEQNERLQRDAAAAREKLLQLGKPR